ncbi:MAG: ABC transporter permease [Pseudomonas sp.]|uniref:ABC transporter permease n=1 Tax=Pseudomonas sp. TaxID=306 RepID=UPI00339B7D70
MTSRLWLPPLAWLLLLLATMWGMPALEPLMAQLQPGTTQLIYQRESLAQLLLDHLLLAGGASLLSVGLGLAAGIAVTRARGRDFLPLANQLATIGQTFPPVAVLALAVPLLGFGNWPTLAALVFYGLLPVLRNSLVGLQGVPADTLEAARGMGMGPIRRLLQVELPLAAPVLLAGIRTTVTLTIATAAIGSTMGASTLGAPVIAGLVNGNNAYVLQGALLIALLALCVDSGFACLQQLIARHQGV